MPFKDCFNHPSTVTRFNKKTGAKKAAPLRVPQAMYVVFSWIGANLPGVDDIFASKKAANAHMKCLLSKEVTTSKVTLRVKVVKYEVCRQSEFAQER
jgi:hypothetical protein